MTPMQSNPMQSNPMQSNTTVSTKLTAGYPNNVLSPEVQNVLSMEVTRALQRGRKDIVFFASHFLGLTLHPGQIRIQRAANGQINVIVCGNRWGKTAGLIAVRHLWYNFYKVGESDSLGEAWTKARYRTAAVAPSTKVLIRNYEIIMDIIRGRFVVSPKGQAIITNQCRIKWFLLEDNCKLTPTPFIQFRDNCAIQFYSTSEDKGAALQGDYFGYGSYDEGGRSYHLETEIDQNLGPRFSELNAPLDIVATPYTDSPSLVFHHEIFQKGLRGEDGYKSFEGSAYENVYLPKHYFLREETRLRKNPIRDQVIDGKFVFSGSQLFPKEDIDACTTKDLNGSKPYIAGHNYITGTDTAIGEDEQVHTVLDVPLDFSLKLYRDGLDKPLELVGWSAHKGSSKSPQVSLTDFLILYQRYDQTHSNYHILETFNGESVRFYWDLPDDIRRRTKPYGTALQPKLKSAQTAGNNETKKIDMIIALKKCLSAHAIRIPEDNKDLIQQLTMYREEDVKLKTDRVISLALACWMATTGKPSNPVVTAVPLNW